MGDFMSTVRAKILNLLKPVLICSKSQKTKKKISHDICKCSKDILTSKFQNFDFFNEMAIFMIF